MGNLTEEMKMRGLKEYSIWHGGEEYKFGFKGIHEEFIEWFNDYIVKTFPKCIICDRIILPFKSVSTCSKGEFHTFCDADPSGFCGYMDEDGIIRPEKDIGKYKEVKAST